MNQPTSAQMAVDRVDKYSGSYYGLPSLMSGEAWSLSPAGTLPQQHNRRMSAAIECTVKTSAPPEAAAGAAALFALPFLFPFNSGPSVSTWQLLATGLCASGLLLLTPADTPQRRILLWLALAAAAIALPLDTSPTLRLPAVASLAGVAAMACCGAGLVRSGDAALHALATGLLAAGLVSTILGLLQFYGLAEPLAPWTTAPAPAQAYGNLRQRNQFATLLNMSLMAALWLHAGSGVRVRRALAAAAVLLLLGLAASASRTGLLELLMIVGISARMAWRERRPSMQAGTLRLPNPVWLASWPLLYFVLSWLLPKWADNGARGIIQRLWAETPMDQARLVLWQNVTDLIAQRPWTGWGWGQLSFAHYQAQYDGPRFGAILDNAHNLPLHLAVELGIPAAVLICGCFAWLVLSARPWREHRPERWLAWGLFGVILVHSLLEYPLWYGPFQMIFGLCLGMLWPARPAATTRQASMPRRMMAAALMSAVLYASWDYVRISQIYLPRGERLPAYAEDTLQKLQSSWLFADQVRFAELTITPVTPSNAVRMHTLAQQVLRFSPEPRVIIKLIESATLIGREEEAKTQALLFRNAFPADFVRWRLGEPVQQPTR